MKNSIRVVHTSRSAVTLVQSLLNMHTIWTQVELQKASLAIRKSKIKCIIAHISQKCSDSIVGFFSLIQVLGNLLNQAKYHFMQAAGNHGAVTAICQNSA